MAETDGRIFSYAKTEEIKKRFNNSLKFPHRSNNNLKLQTLRGLSFESKIVTTVLKFL